MPTTTTNYDLLKPLVNSATDQDLWGGYLNDDMDDIDTLLRAGITFDNDAKTSSFTASASISTKLFYPCDATSAAITATIPEAATAGEGATVAVKKTDSSANAVTLTRSGSDTIDGDTSVALEGENDAIIIVSDGVSKWNSIARGQDVPYATTSSNGVVQLATSAETLTGTDTNKPITPGTFAGNKDLQSAGYYKLPGDFILQWGFSALTSTTRTTNFTTAFTTACYGVWTQGSSNNVVALVDTVTTTSFRTIQSVGATYYWFAIGK